jgi:hypothetical protein
VSRGSSLVAAYFQPTVVSSDRAARIVAALTMIAAVDEAVDAAKASAAAADAPAPFLLRRQSETLSRTSSINSVVAPPPRAHAGGRVAQAYRSAHDGSDSDEDEFDKATAAALEAIERKAAAAAAAKAQLSLTAQQPQDFRRMLSGTSAQSIQTAASAAVADDADGLFVASEHEHRIIRIRSTDRESREPTPSTPALLRRVSDTLRTIEEGVVLTQQKLHADASSFVSSSSLSHSASHSGLTSLASPAASHSESAGTPNESAAAGSPQPALQPRPPAHARPPSLSRASTLGRRGNAAGVSVLPSLAEGVEPPTASAKPAQLSSPVASPAAVVKPPASMRAVSMSIVAWCERWQALLWWFYFMLCSALLVDFASVCALFSHACQYVEVFYLGMDHAWPFGFLNCVYRFEWFVSLSLMSSSWAAMIQRHALIFSDVPNYFPDSVHTRQVRFLYLQSSPLRLLAAQQFGVVHECEIGRECRPLDAVARRNAEKRIVGAARKRWRGRRRLWQNQNQGTEAPDSDANGCIAGARTSARSHAQVNADKAIACIARLWEQSTRLHNECGQRVQLGLWAEYSA